MRKMSKKIIVSVLTLVLTVVALGTTTYAWFTVGGSVSIDEFDMQVTSGLGLEIAYMPTGITSEKDIDLMYRKVISSDELYKFLDLDYNYSGNMTSYPVADSLNFQNNFVLESFTSMDGRAMLALTEAGDNLVTAGKKDGFIEFTLAFRTKENIDPDDGLPLYINSFNMTSGGKLWRNEVDYTGLGGAVIAGTDQTHYVMNAARVSLADKLDATKTTVFEKEDDGNVNRQLSDNDPNWTQGAHSYYKEVTGIDLGDVFGTPGTNTTYAGYKAVKTETGLGSNGYLEIARFKELEAGDVYKYASVTVRIYVEGFDSEAFNAVFDDVLKVSFGFTIYVD